MRKREQPRTMSRRKMLGSLAAAVPLLSAAPSLLSLESLPRKRLGVCAYSYNLHWKAARESQLNLPFKDTLDFLDYCHSLGARGVQVGVGSKDLAYAAKVRAKAEAHQMYFE